MAAPYVTGSDAEQGVSGHISAQLREFLGYGVASGIALAVDAGLLRTLVGFAGWHYLVAATLAFIAGTVVAYSLSIWFVFRSRQVRSGALEFGLFAALGLVGLLVNAGVMSVAVGVLSMDLMLAKGMAAICTFAANFLLRRWVLFSSRRIVQ
jgi:putative flippase GtrA